jgi:WD40 repeat protein
MKTLIKLISTIFLLLQITDFSASAMKNPLNEETTEELTEALSNLSLNDISFLDALFLSNLRPSSLPIDAQKTIEKGIHDLSELWDWSDRTKTSLYLRIISISSSAEKVFILPESLTLDKNNISQKTLLSKKEAQACLKTRVMPTSNSCKILDEITGEKFGPLHGAGYITTAVLSPDKTKILTQSLGQNIAILWNANNSKPICKFNHSDSITWVGFSSYHQINCVITASLDKTIKIWNLRDGTLIRTLKNKFPAFTIYVTNEYIEACSLSAEKVTYWPLSTVNFKMLSFEQFILTTKLQQCLETGNLIWLNKKWRRIFYTLPELLKIKFYPILKRKNK